MNNKLFGISNPFEDAKKLDREYKRLSISSGNKNENQNDHALNFSLTAWHLADKVFNYPDTQNALKEKGINDWGTFLNYVFELCPEIRVCRDLSIIYKHYDNKTAKTVESATQVLELIIAKINGVPINEIAQINGVSFSQIAKVNGMPVDHEKLIVKTTDGAELNFMDIASAVNEFWQRELNALKT